VLHFNYLSDTEGDRLFYRRPQPFDAECDPTLLAVALGATLYSPATVRFGQDLSRRLTSGVTGP
jgi:hypothetical protein